MFDKFKAKHGGEGPLELAYGSMFPEGILGRRGLDDERELTNQVLEKVQADETLVNLDGLITAAQSPLTRKQHAAVRSALRRRSTRSMRDSPVFKRSKLRCAGTWSTRMTRNSSA